jgi:hypothetical protein
LHEWEFHAVYAVTRTSVIFARIKNIEIFFVKIIDIRLRPGLTPDVGTL